ncbi:MAG: hypothetical protein ACJAT7_000744 [Psychromonas sp.]|jgi:hypothetical protein
MVKEIIKMDYLWRDNVLLNGDAMQKKLGEKMVMTPFATVIKNILSKRT